MLTNRVEIERVDPFATRDTSSKADQTAATRRDWQVPGPWATSSRAVAMPADQVEIERVDQLLPSRRLARLVRLQPFEKSRASSAVGSDSPVEPGPS